MKRRCVLDAALLAAMGGLSGAYLLFVFFMLAADAAATSFADLQAALGKAEIRFALGLSLLTATLSSLLSVAVATPIAYLMSRGRGPWPPRERPAWLRTTRLAAEALLDAPIVLPPLVVGISLLVLFRYEPFAWFAGGVVYQVPAIVLAQFVVVCALAVRVMRAAFDQIPDRQECVAMTLGAGRWDTFWRVLMPQARPGLLTAATISWARALGEFGPVLVFAGSTRMKTEVLTTSIYLELQAGNLRSALAVSVVMVGCAMLALMAARLLGAPRAWKP